jgi:hypothetical protein
MRRAKLQAIDAINTLCCTGHDDENDDIDIMETLENADEDHQEAALIDIEETIEFPDDDILNATHFCEMEAEGDRGP